MNCSRKKVLVGNFVSYHEELNAKFAPKKFHEKEKLPKLTS